MTEMTYQQRSNQSTRMAVNQQRSSGRVLQDNRAVFKQSTQLKIEDKDEEKVLQKKSASAVPVQREEQVAKPNNTGLPDNLKSGIENLSGMSMDNVKVHYNSSKPAQLNALAYAQGTDIHVASGQEKHLPHEAWHVVQQAQGRVKPTMQMKGGVPVNDDKGLEREADVMGGRAVQIAQVQNVRPITPVYSLYSVTQLYRIGYTPNLDGLTVPGGGEADYNYDSFNRPAEWYNNTLDQLFARAVTAGRVHYLPQFNITLVQCESAGSWHNINDMQIGHIRNWQQYVSDTQPATVREATNAYNDLNNLRLEGSTPNTSHDFEGDRDSENDDTDLSDDDFIDKSDGGIMNAEARKMLDEYKADQSQFYRNKNK